MTGFARWVTIITLFLVPFLPLYVAGDFSPLGHLFFPFITGKGFLFRILIEIAAGAWLFLALADRRYRPRFSFALMIYAALVAWMFIADLFAVNPHKAFWSNFERMDGFITMIHVFVFFLIAGSFLTVEKLWKKWWMAAVAASALVTLIGFLQLAGLFGINQSGVRLDANIGNAAYLAAYLLFTIAASAWLSLEHKGVWRYVFLALAALETVILYFTATRGALLGFVGAVALAALLWSFWSGKVTRKIGLIAFGGVVLIIAGFFAVKDTPLVEQDPTLSRIASVSLEDGKVRFMLWNMGWQGVMEDPLTGLGHEGYFYAFTKYFNPSMYGQETWFDRAHSVYLDWLVAGGFPAFFLFIALLISGAVSFVRSDRSRAERIFLLSALAAYAFQAIFVFDNLLTYVFLAALLAIAHTGVARPFTRLEALPELPVQRLTTTIAPIIAVVTLGTVWFVNVPSIYSGQELIKGLSTKTTNLEENVTHFKNALSSGTFASQEVREQFIGFASQIVRMGTLPADFRAATLTLSIEEMNKELARVPFDARLRLMVGQGYEAGGDFASALREIDAALALSPQKQTIIIQEGIELWKMGRREEAREAFYRALNLAPEFREVAVYAAAGDIITGDAATARALLMENFGTAPVDRDILRFAYFEAKQYADLITLAKQKVEATGGSPQARLELAQMYAYAGRLAEAIAETRATMLAFPEAKEAGEQLLKQFGA